MGYSRAGFDVVGVDIKPQPRYPFQFVQADALHFVRSFGAGFDVIHASPPCQRYSMANNIHGNPNHPDLVAPTRDALLLSGRSYVIENVPGAPLGPSVCVCGLALGLGVKRHRWFESGHVLFGTQCAGHQGDWVSVFGHTVLERSPQIGRTAKGGPIFRRKHLGTERGRDAMGISWMTREELSEAIPPAYTEYIGRQLWHALEPATSLADGQNTDLVVAGSPAPKGV